MKSGLVYTCSIREVSSVLRLIQPLNYRITGLLHSSVSWRDLWLHATFNRLLGYVCITQ